MTKKNKAILSKLNMEDIKASELRLGNLFQTIEGKVMVKICELYIADEGEDDNGYSWCNLEHNFKEYQAVSGDRNIEPISLTPKIIERCSFSKLKNPKLNKDEWEIRIGVMDIIISGKGFWDVYTKYNPLLTKMTSDINYNYITDNIGIRYLHQLQNLIFSLTREELKFNVE